MLVIDNDDEVREMRDAATALSIGGSTGEPVATESAHDWFGKGPSEKDPSRAPRRRPTSLHVRFCEQPRGKLPRLTRLVLIVKGTRAQAQAIKDVCRQFLDQELSLTLNVEKTRITHVNDGFVFLGHRVVRKRSSRGHWRPVTDIPHDSVSKLARKLTELLSSNYDMDSHLMIMKLNQIISGWTAFYRHTMYTSRIFGKLDTIVFWKFGHWLARKHRTRVNKVMRRWYGYSKRYGCRTWLLHKTVDGHRVSTTLIKFAWSRSPHPISSPPAVNPFFGARTVIAGGGHYSYQHIALLTEA